MAPDFLKGVLITGASGQVGGELVRAFTSLPQFERVYAPSRAELDLSDPGSIRRSVRERKPRWILNPGAYTGVDRAESEPEAAYAINAEAVRVLGEEAASLGSAMLHFSTDYVFDGENDRPYTEADTPNPRSVYGASKLAGEQALAATGAAHLIFRTSWVYGATGKNFLRTILRAARERAGQPDQPLRIVNDQHGAPTWSRELARITVAVVEQCERAARGRTLAEAVREVEGVYHATSAGETTWFGFATEALAQYSDLRPGTAFAPVVPISSSEYVTPARRPANSRLNCAKLEERFHRKLPAWQASLAQVMQEIGDAERPLS